MLLLLSPAYVPEGSRGQRVTVTLYRAVFPTCKMGLKTAPPAKDCGGLKGYTVASVRNGTGHRRPKT